jgi:hypothetical protein
MASTDPVLCFTCKKDFSKGRNPQIVVCCSCKELVHRVCLPENLSPQEYVRLKKNNKVLDFECILCYAKKHGVKSSVSRKRKAPAKKPEPRPKKATTKPQQLLVNAPMIGVRIVASTPLDEVIRPTPQMAVSPIEVLVTSLAQVTITHQVTISPADEIHLADWSSRFFPSCSCT